MQSFLSPLAGAEASRFVLENRRSGEIVARTLLPALDSASRNEGLLGRDTLAPGSAMIIAPCFAVHTFFMRFSIDVIFVARDGRVIKIRTNVRPWRIAAAFGAFATIELASGAAEVSTLARGDELALRALE